MSAESVSAGLSRHTDSADTLDSLDSADTLDTQDTVLVHFQHVLVHVQNVDLLSPVTFNPVGCLYITRLLLYLSTYCVEARLTGHTKTTQVLHIFSALYPSSGYAMRTLETTLCSKKLLNSCRGGIS